MAWSTKGSRGPFLSIIRSFYWQKVLVVLQKVHVVTILHRAVVAIGEAFSKLGVLLGFSLISLHDLFCATGDGFKSEVSCFLLLGLAIVHFALWGLVFSLDFDPFFFLLLFPHSVFFLYLFIYLFI